MPIYDYKCPVCNSVATELYVKPNTSNENLCLECDTKMEKQVTQPAIHFKGTGFYETDYKGK